MYGDGDVILKGNQRMYAILSDIHGNLYALKKVADDIKKYCIDGIILLGDIIDYGMRSNEIIRKLVELEEGIWKNKIIVNISNFLFFTNFLRI